MDPNKALNMTMLCDFYELTMGNGYLEHGMQDRITYFDVFFRSVPDDGGYAIAAGLEQIIDYIENLHFTDEDIAYLRSRKLFSEAFLDYLKNFRFTGDIWAVPEGTPVFPREPLITVRAPAIQAQLVETYLLLQINHQSLIATKASRICRAAQGRTVLEFGSRRAQGSDGAILGARAAYIGGCAGTACTISDELYGVYAGGTMAHSWVQMFDSELDAFRAYCQTYPDNATLLVDTYNSLQSGGAEISATPRGYVLPQATDGITRTIACRHTLEQTGQELDILVDNGCTVLDVIVEHPVYGQLTGQLQISSRYDVEQFLARVQAHDAAPLSILTGGIHLHTLRCPDEAACARACAALKAAGLLLDD